MVVTLLLTAVAFKLVVSDILPKVSYWTLLDVYLNAMFLLLLVVAVENGCVGFVANRAPHLFEHYSDSIEIGTAAFVGIAWLVFHVWFIATVVSTRHQETESLEGLRVASEAAQVRHDKQRVAFRRSGSVGGGDRLLSGTREYIMLLDGRGADEKPGGTLTESGRLQA